MSDSMLTLFKGQLEAECEKIRTDYELHKRGDWLIWWYFMRLHSFSSAEVGEIHCDGGGDLGIDALWIDDDEVVHFYNFKNPQNLHSMVDAGDIDKTISGLQVIISKSHGKIANDDLKSRVSEIYTIIPKGYVIHIVTSGMGIPEESSTKLNSLVEGLGPTMFSWKQEGIGQLHDRFYTQSLRSVDTPIIFQLQSAPHAVRSGLGDIHFFSASGKFLAQVYDEYGEGLLERNIRVDQGYTPTNKSIESSCSGESSANFIHYNNGVTFICKSAVFDSFGRHMNLNGSQIVNGGQTIRSLHRCFKGGTLRDDVVVFVRAITGSDDKYFANDVAVNQNNQNPMGLGFLRSTDARVVQLSHSLASIGWHLETRSGEVAAFSKEDRVRAETRIGKSLDGNVIRLKDGLQAYAATYFGNPELAKKNAKMIFLSEQDGGYFERIFSKLTAPDFVIAHLIKSLVDDFVRLFAAKKRRKDRVEDWQQDYRTLLGDDVHADVLDVADQMIPQCAVFVCGALFALGDVSTITGWSGDTISKCVLSIIGYAQRNPSVANKGWPSLLKSKTFFDSYVSAMKESRAQKDGVTRKK